MPDMRPFGPSKGRGEKYGAAHKRERERLKPIVDAGRAECAQPVCLMPSRRIAPGEPWALGHDDSGTRWIGPVHQRCNIHDGAVRGGRAALAKRRIGGRQLTGRTSRQW
jgi:hypothetical protein